MVKRFLTIIMLAALTLPALSQYQPQHIPGRYQHSNTARYYGLRLGLNVACINSDVIDVDMDSRTGLNVGAVYGLQLSNSAPIWLELGAFYSEKGGKSRINGSEIKTRLSYIQVPIVMKYSFDVYDDLYLQPFLGGYLALGVGGKTKNYTDRVSYSSFDNFNRFDGGLRVGCGIEYLMLYAEAGFDFGLANIYKDDFTTARTQNIFISIGVNF